MNQLTARQVVEKIRHDKQDSVLIDVRTYDEFCLEHCEGAQNVPLDQLEQKLSSLPKDKLIVLNCQSGVRSAKAYTLLKEQGFEQLAELEGGFKAWKEAGLPVRARRKSAMSVQHQVQTTAGSLVALGTLLGIIVNPWFLAVPLFIGLGLTQAGITGWCGMAKLLEVFPWNRS